MRRRCYSSASSNQQPTHKTRHLVIGGGVVGLACAHRLSRFGSTVLAERHPRFGEETSSRNSEVIHAGIYYPPTSLKTKLCIRGKELLYKFADETGVPYKRCGKWLIAQNDTEVAYLEKMRIKCADLGVSLEWLPRKTISSEEPLLRAQDALFSPTTGIIDSHSLMSALEASIQMNEGIVAYGTQVMNITKHPNNQGYIVETGPDPCVFEADIIVNAAGLSATKIASMLLANNTPSNYETYFCKGHYFGYSGKPLVKRLIYPVPEKNLAGLGVHATVDLAGRMRFGPDTLYIDSSSDYSVGSGTQLEKVHEAVSKYLPSVEREKLYPDYAGIRPKLSRKGEEARDFLIQLEDQRGLPGVVNLLGIESPGLTSALAIAEHVETLLGYTTKTSQVCFENPQQQWSFLGINSQKKHARSKTLYARSLEHTDPATLSFSSRKTTAETIATASSLSSLKSNLDQSTFMNSAIRFEPDSPLEWRAWLEKHHESIDAVWLVIRKKNSARPNLSWSEAVDEALCFGWIDSTTRRIDEHRREQYFTRRKAKSSWSKINKQKIERLKDEKKMHAAGLRAVEIAVANGSWTALDAAESLLPTPDLVTALQAEVGLLARFEALPSGAKKLALTRITSVKRQETRAKRIVEVVESLKSKDEAPRKKQRKRTEDE